MPKYVIEREMPGVGALPEADIVAASTTSNCVLADMAGRAQWVQSFVTADKIFCVYLAENEQAVHDHAKAAGLPANAVHLVMDTIDPTTADR